jgi:hypothetical protein
MRQRLLADLMRKFPAQNENFSALDQFGKNRGTT